MLEPRTVVVVGHGMVGHRFVESLRRRDTEGAWRVVVLAEESRPAYDRVALSSYVGEATEDDLALADDEFHADGLVELHLDDPAVAVDRSARRVTTRRGRAVDYDELVLATGSVPFVPPVPGHDLDGVFVYRTLDDLDGLRAAAETATADAGAGRRSGVVVGGGLLGLEAANALRQLGLSPHVVEMAPRLMPVQVDDAGGALLYRLVSDLGLRVHTGVSTSSIARDHRGGLTVTLSDGTELDASVVVFSAGIRPADALAREIGLDVGERGGVLVDERCRTTDEHVWAIGEVAAVRGRTYGLVAPGYAMAEVVAGRLAGDDAEARFTEADLSTKLKLLGVDVASFGDAHATTAGALEVRLDDPVTGTYSKLVVSDDARTLLGGVLVGDASNYETLRGFLGAELPGDPMSLIAPAGEGAVGVGIDALPDGAQICSCNAVTKGALVDAIASGEATTVPQLKACTRAGTTCGSCVPTLGKVLASCGVEVSKALCEHFAQSRAELYEIVLATGLATFSEILAAYGTGHGCDVCKPAVASMLATLAGGHVLDGESATLQDTNDHALANMQRNGTYSVVPRLPGGEVTGEGLIAIGEVARDFGLYTKITGGQRIDMFGARLDDLPRIWKRLVDAGFESGHAYGKALRTVKSCVGTDWCRYGVQDSVGLAVALELRYRGLRSPHKLKSGVSGCARECAEARSKDFGIIATEHGWNLYVGGNGGFTPRHAELLASDLDTGTLVRTIDRYLMFYVRTADRLQRTAPWIESLEGGIDHLREVVIEDSLGICASLDEQMARHVRSYADEWAAVLDDPDKLARFTSFVNAPGTPDPTIEFVDHLGRRVPAGMKEGQPTDLGSLGFDTTPAPTRIAGPTIPVGAPA
ncbi:nitrite reductase large subunit NirB [Actinomycetospora sp. TBRC 11914]|uniref:nitrite reductase large subunit NirB n=1 Tax=Actinomycetospora sp. TBRC 11914 TaxID=2729387 RepID=UPI00145C8F20|nr:nitrite reductase large subunit NirB [Actinomycetospora sp. TBRC 11914]NMO88764.1 nitrite reductase large subunit [Actinomycetospora sp. TBRC 11914]